MPSARTAFAGSADSLLLNVSGKLMLLTPAHTSGPLSEDSDERRMYEVCRVVESDKSNMPSSAPTAIGNHVVRGTNVACEKKRRQLATASHTSIVVGVGFERRTRVDAVVS